MIMASSSSSSANQAMADNPNTPNTTTTTTNNNTINNINNHLPPLQCPRCNSSNTKFCYYNNYSLSQPRHFCKACKRYWTRGGTLRNVPVGGGCRKNKRIKRPPPSSSGAPNPKIDLQSQTNSHHINNNNNPLFYGLNPLNPISFPFSGLSSTRVFDNNNDNNNNKGFDFQAQMNGLGLGFSSGLMYGSSASLLSSSFQNQKFGNGYVDNNLKDMISQAGSGLVQYEEMQMGGDHVKVEGDQIQDRLGWSPNQDPNPVEQIDYSDPSLIWNSTNVGSWFDPSSSNMGSSVPSLI